jgi:hypothetical protein
MPASFAGLILLRQTPKKPRHFTEIFSAGRLMSSRPTAAVLHGCALWGQDVGSLYQLKSALLAHGIPSHWTPYVRVDDVENAVQRAIGFGGVIVAEPFSVFDVARIALIEDSVGALVGLWQPIASNKKANGHD